MTDLIRPRVKYVIGPDGSPLTIADLPPANTRRWVIRRKAEVVAAVRGGLLSLEEACDRYTLTVEEFLSWQSSINDHGLAGLRTTRGYQEIAAGRLKIVRNGRRTFVRASELQRYIDALTAHSGRGAA